MKYFKCGHCQSPYKIDETKVTSSMIVIKCNQCGTGNIVRFGPILVAQTKEQTKQFSLQLGENKIGRVSDDKQVEISIKDPYVSKNHATINLEEREGKIFFFIRDDKSTNGTFNRNKLKLKSELKYPFTPNDFYIIGLTKLSIKFT
jgi:predicted Zn finger-like uncharacterized protein